MRRAAEVLASGTWSAAKAVDTVTLDFAARHRRRIVMTGDSGTAFLLDLQEAAALRDGDGLLLDDATIVCVRAEPEPLLEARCATVQELSRVAWHLGNRHLAVQVVGDVIRLREDHVIAAMLEGLGATVRKVSAPFDPEGGAYGGHGSAPAVLKATVSGLTHAHTHDHEHDHGHNHDHPHPHRHVHG